jgi:hypothetical protein
MSSAEWMRNQEVISAGRVRLVLIEGREGGRGGREYSGGESSGGRTEWGLRKRVKWSG